MPDGRPLRVADTEAGERPEPGLGAAEASVQLLIQSGGMQLIPYRKTVELTLAPLGLTVPDSFAPLMPMFEAAPATGVGTSCVVSCCSLPQIVLTVFVAQRP